MDLVETIPKLTLAQVSQEFLGVWVSAPNNQSDGYDCRRTDWALRENDGLINVTPRYIEHWESSCDVSTFRALSSQAISEQTAEVVLACGGEGMTWRTREIWSLKRINSRKTLVMVQLQSSEMRDETKKPDTRLLDEVRVDLYLECQ
jgi:hypothetical protein